MWRRCWITHSSKLYQGKFVSPFWKFVTITSSIKLSANLWRSFLRRSSNDPNLFPIDQFQTATSRSKKCWGQRRKKWRKKSLSRYKYVLSFLRRQFFRVIDNFGKSAVSKTRLFRAIDNFGKSSCPTKQLFRSIILVTQDPVQPLCNQVQITDKEILEQEDKGENYESYKWVIMISVSRAQNALARAMALYAKQNNSIELMS